jgi:hypothetical protein
LLPARKGEDILSSAGADPARLYLNGQEVDRDGYRGGLTGNEEPLVIGVRAWLSGARAADNLESLLRRERRGRGISTRRSRRSRSPAATMRALAARSSTWSTTAACRRRWRERPAERRRRRG